MSFRKYFVAVTGMLVVCLSLLSCTHTSPKGTALQPIISTNQRVNQKREPILLISIDGYRHAYWANHPLKTLSRYGCRVDGDGVQPVAPSLTFPNHYSAITGLRPSEHGIFANHFYSPALRKSFHLNVDDPVTNPLFFKGEALWESIEKKGYRAATMFWPGTGIQNPGRTPGLSRKYEHELSHDDRISQIFQWLDLPDGEAPSLVTLYFSDVDDAGHRYGPDSPEVADAIDKVDRSLEKIFTQVDHRAQSMGFHILVMSDHGIAAVDDAKMIELDDVIHPSDLEHELPMEASSFVTPRPDAFARVLKALRLHALKTKGFQVYSADHHPSYYRIDFSKPSTPPILLEAAEGGMVGIRAHTHHKSAPKGMHGYAPRLPSMQAMYANCSPRKSLFADQIKETLSLRATLESGFQKIPDLPKRALAAGCSEARSVLGLGSGSTRLRTWVVNRCIGELRHQLAADQVPVLYKKDLSREGAQEKFSDEIQKFGLQAIQDLLARRTSVARAATEIRGVATEAFRKAKNSGEYFSTIEQDTGVRIRLIDQEEEGNRAARAVFARVPEGRATKILLDIGGGSSQLTVQFTKGAEGQPQRPWSQFRVALGAFRARKAWNDALLSVGVPMDEQVEPTLRATFRQRQRAHPLFRKWFRKEVGALLDDFLVESKVVGPIDFYAVGGVAYWSTRCFARPDLASVSVNDSLFCKATDGLKISTATIKRRLQDHRPDVLTKQELLLMVPVSSKYEEEVYSNALLMNEWMRVLRVPEGTFLSVESEDGALLE